jgi:hypothetical protein
MTLDKPIKFTVKGKPPKKSKWGNDNNAKLIIALREAALKARIDAGYSHYIDTNVNLKLTVYATNISLFLRWNIGRNSNGLNLGPFCM